MSNTPQSDALEKTRRKLGAPRSPAYGDALALCRKLEIELNKWQAPFDAVRFAEAQKQASHKDSLAAMCVYVTALEHALKAHAELLKQAYAALDTCYRGDCSTGNVIHPSFDETLVDAAHAAIAKALAP